MKNLILVAGVSGSGKSYLEGAMKALGYLRGITSTTRAMRDGEVNGVDYFFETEESMTKMKSEGKLVESATIRGNTYGMTTESLSKVFELTDRIFLVLDPQGIKQYQDYFSTQTTPYNIVTVFIDCPNDIQEARIRARLPDSPSKPQLHEVAKALLCAKEFEQSWREMVTADIYCPISRGNDDVAEILNKIHRSVSSKSEPELVASIEPHTWSPSDRDVDKMISNLSSSRSPKFKL